MLRKHHDAFPSGDGQSKGLSAREYAAIQIASQLGQWLNGRVEQERIDLVAETATRLADALIDKLNEVHQPLHRVREDDGQPE